MDSLGRGEAPQCPPAKRGPPPQIDGWEGTPTQHQQGRAAPHSAVTFVPPTVHPLHRLPGVVRLCRLYRSLCDVHRPVHGGPRTMHLQALDSIQLVRILYAYGGGQAKSLPQRL